MNDRRLSGDQKAGSRMATGRSSGPAARPDAVRIRPGYWFKPKTFGWGAVPVTWQGWALTLAFVAIAAAIAHLAERHSPIWLIMLVPAVLGFVWLCWRKTDGGWSWHWGKRDRAG